MNIWVLILLSINTSNLQIFVNSFDSEIKCERRLSEMATYYKMKCIKTTLNGVENK